MNEEKEKYYRLKCWTPLLAFFGILIAPSFIWDGGTLLACLYALGGFFPLPYTPDGIEGNVIGVVWMLSMLSLPLAMFTLSFRKKKGIYGWSAVATLSISILSFYVRTTWFYHFCIL